MPPRDWEKVRAEQRQRARGVERLSGTGYTRELVARAAKGVASAERFIHEAQRWEPLEDVVERSINTIWLEQIHPGEPRETRAERMARTRSILDACED
jgi:predicted xylose isomerase-like sugar epimerase